MLRSLHIQHFAIVAELELDFSAGMTVFTGETGAGKSIMIDALLLTLGARADASVIRPGEEQCDIQASFTYIPYSAPEQWLNDHDLSTEEQEILLRRVITVEGRSKAYINGVSFPLQKVKELSELLVHIHGQHEHQTLLTHTTHRQHLDAYANHGALGQEVHQAYRQCQLLDAERQTLALSDPQALDVLILQIAELQALSPLEGEIEQLHAEQHRLQHAKTYLEHIQTIQYCIDTDEGPSIRQQLHQVMHTLAVFPQDHPRINAASALFENARIACDEAIADLDVFTRELSLDPERLIAVESRMSALHHFARKYRVDVHQLAQHSQTLIQQQHAYQQGQQQKATLEQRYQEAKEAYQAVALKLRSSRQQYAPLLAEQITANIQPLGMPHGFITIEMTPLETMQAHGLDKVEYKVSSNPGMRPDLLSKVASGGELSRVSLAIQMIAAQQGSTATLIFDEIDVGIGGTTAAIVGQKLRQLGKRLQVCCVTHQPQVAASAHHHFEVRKYTENQQTFSLITCLTPENKIEEIARMLGGLTVTPQTRVHAQEMLISLGQ